VSADTSKNSSDIATATLACSKCGAALPEDAQFCLKCGKAVSFSPKAASTTDSAAEAKAAPKPKRKFRIVLGVLLALVLIGIAWTATSDNPWAQGIQELAGWKHDQAILQTEAPFSVAAHAFRFYKFSLPESSTNVSIIGQFSAAPDKHGAKSSGTNSDADNDSNIEVFVLSEPAFAVWEKGYAASSVYESGKVQQGTLHSELPAGGGVYYLVFSNKSALKSGKSVNASILLRYKSWVPSWMRSFKNTIE
jgi:ribosomal protein L40E